MGMKSVRSFLASVAFVFLTLCAPLYIEGAPVLFDLRADAIEDIDEVASFSLTIDGLTATLSALVGGSTNAGDVLNRTASGFGVNAAGVGDATDQIDSFNGN